MEPSIEDGRRVCNTSLIPKTLSIIQCTPRCHYLLESVYKTALSGNISQTSFYRRRRERTHLALGRHYTSKHWKGLTVTAPYRSGGTRRRSGERRGEKWKAIFGVSRGRQTSSEREGNRLREPDKENK
ncbi:hypothetical protein PoB_003060000 [Plakobranchus ocellatus]|uniref:Uncharacterized protein n=1 Tax=Plakobranchus ocellatus TaxID=259542 RepID=A0AAV4AB86_9GAST|nr:hypothetical protein PoB_003060000 [Plakobranchus ocellatus]